MLRIRDVYPESLSQGQKDPGSGSATKKLIKLPVCIFKLWEIYSKMFILDLGIKIFPIPDPGVKKALDPGSGCATLLDRYQAAEQGYKT